MALYTRSHVCRVFKLACNRWTTKSVVLHEPVVCLLTQVTDPVAPVSYLSSFLGAYRNRSPTLFSCFWRSDFRCMSTERVLKHQGGLFLSCYHNRNFAPTFWQDDNFSSFQRYSPQDASQVRGYRRYYQKAREDPKPATPDSKPSIWKRFKDMYKEYWYVLVPVHVVTSIIWYGSFYYIASSGFDLVHFLENLNASESIIKPFRNSKAGYFAIAYAMYKIATPARYTVTLGGTTVSINYLRKWGYIKPIPSPAAMQQMIKDKRTAFQQGLYKRQAAKRARKTKEKEEKERSKKP